MERSNNCGAPGTLNPRRSKSARPFKFLGILTSRRQSESLGLQRSPEVGGDDKKNGIFQSDALSPTLFVLSVTPISHVLNHLAPVPRAAIDSIMGFSAQLGHEFYIDAMTKDDLESWLALVWNVLERIGLGLNTTKCAKAQFMPWRQTDDTIMMRGFLKQLSFVNKCNSYNT